jgi:IS30 family transposase
MKKYQRLNEEERDEVVALLNRRKSIRENRERTPSTISREIKRSFGKKKISSEQRAKVCARQIQRKP